MAEGYHMTSKFKIPKRSKGNYIAGVRFNRNKNEFNLVLKDSGKIKRKWDIGSTAAFLGYLTRKFATGDTGISKKMLSVGVSFLIRNKNSEITKSIHDF